MQSKSLDLTILICAILIGLLLRFYQLDLISPWYDEIASVYFAAHPKIVFYEETHTPLFYLFLTPFVSLFGKNIEALRFVVVSFGLIINGISIFLSRKILSSKGVLLLAIILMLNHIDYHHGRMIRQYGIMFDLTILLLLMSQVQEMKRGWTILVSILLCWFHPIGFIIPFSLLVNELISERKITTKFWDYGIPVFSVVLYYLSKIIFLTKDEFRAFYDVGPNLNWAIIGKILRGLSGEYYPRMNVYNITIWPQMIVIGFICLVLVWGIMMSYRSKNLESNFQKTLILIILNTLFIIGFSLIAFNILLPRYFIFLLAPFVVCFVSWAQRIRYVEFFVFGTLLFLAVELNPFLPYEAEGDTFTEYHSLKSENKELGLVMCATKAQYYFYFDSPQIHCLEQLKELKKDKKNFYFISMNGHGLQELVGAARENNVTKIKRRGVVLSAIVLRKE